jgi:Ion channel
MCVCTCASVQLRDTVSSTAARLFGDEEESAEQALSYHQLEAEGDLDEDGIQPPPTDELVHTLDRLQRDVDALRAALGASRQSRARHTAHAVHPKRDPWLKPWIVNNTLWITILWQVLNLMLLAFTGGYDSSTSVTSNIAIAIMTVFQLLNIVFILVVSVKLVKQLVHRTASGWFLAQSYLSTLLLFGGIYHLLFRIAASSFDGILEEVQAQTHSPFAMLLLVAVRCWYFSITAVTTTGFGDIVATRWYSQVVVSLQMLLSTVYTTVIFAKGLSHFTAFPSSSSGRGSGGGSGGSPRNGGSSTSSAAHDERSPDVYHDERSPDVYHDERSPDVYHDERSPDVYHDERSPDVYHDERQQPYGSAGHLATLGEQDLTDDEAHAHDHRPDSRFHSEEQSSFHSSLLLDDEDRNDANAHAHRDGVLDSASQLPRASIPDLFDDL